MHIYSNKECVVKHHQSCQKINIFVDKRMRYFYTDVVRQKNGFSDDSEEIPEGKRFFYQSKEKVRNLF